MKQAFWNKKSQSQIIGVVLLILLVLAAVAIIATFAINYVKDRLNKADCVDFVGAIEIKDSYEFSCFYDDGIPASKNETYVQVHIGDLKEKQKFIEGFRIIVLTKGITQTYEIKEGGSNPKVGLYNKGPVGSPLEIPGKNEERTYNITYAGIEKPESVSALLIIDGGRTCEGASDTLTYENCVI